MHAADAVLWEYADEHHSVPMSGLDEMPSRIRDDISRWLRRQATPCPHSVALALTGVVFRVVGRPQAWCAACASEVDIEAMTKTCAHCARIVGDGGHAVAVSVAGACLICAAWCADCWNEETNT